MLNADSNENCKKINSLFSNKTKQTNKQLFKCGTDGRVGERVDVRSRDYQILARLRSSKDLINSISYNKKSSMIRNRNEEFLY